MESLQSWNRRERRRPTPNSSKGVSGRPRFQAAAPWAGLGRSSKMDGAKEGPSWATASIRSPCRSSSTGSRPSSRRWARRCCAPRTRRSSTRAGTSRRPSATPRAGWSRRPSTCPIHVGAIPWAVRSVQEFFGDRVRPGDVYLLNDPYHGNNHLPDLTAFVPVFAPVGRWTRLPPGRTPEGRERLGREDSGSSSGRSTARTRATSAARPTAPTTPARPRSGRKGSASRRCASTRPAWSGTTCSR